MYDILNDETGVAVNEFLTRLARVFIWLTWTFPLSGLIATFIALGAIGIEPIAWLFFCGGIVMGISCFFGAVFLLWFSTLGNNIDKMRKFLVVNDEINDISNKTKMNIPTKMCGRCGKEYAKDCKSCPHCGYRE